jgi:hypothetical protein
VGTRERERGGGEGARSGKEGGREGRSRGEFEHADRVRARVNVRVNGAEGEAERYNKHGTLVGD